MKHLKMIFDHAKDALNIQGDNFTAVVLEIVRIAKKTIKYCYRFIWTKKTKIAMPVNIYWS